MTSSESEGNAPSRKRSRTSAGSEDAGSKKARGRPRVDTQDETAADRRRTQIRLAQRAYRQRKETTISSLKKDVSKLEATIEEMNRSFLRFHDMIVNSGVLNPRQDLAQELRTVTETFVRLAKTSTDDQNENEEEDMEEPVIDVATELHNAGTAARASRESRTLPPPMPAPIPQHTDIGWGYSTHFSTSPRPSSPQNRFSAATYLPSLNYDSLPSRTGSLPMTVGQVIDQSRSALDATNKDELLPFGLIDMLSREVSPNSLHPQTFFATVPSPRITPPPTRTPTPPEVFNSSLNTSLSLRAPYTYSFQESTFARRLTRASLERGFRLLSMASSRPAAVAHVFKLSLPFITVDQMLARFKVLLTKGTRDSLDCWTAPFIHLGGAGTHYPQKDENGKIIPTPNSWNVRSIGPQRRVRLNNATEPSLHQDLDVDLRGYEGEWFDAHDVAGYLEEKGIHIEGQASFAEAFIESEDSQNDDLESLIYSSNINLDLDIDQGQNQGNGSPAASNGGSNTSVSNSSVSEPRTPSVPNVDQILNSNSPFGLDMGGNFSDSTKIHDINDINASGMFEQPLALDLAGTFDANMFNDIGTYPGMDMMGTDVEPVVVKQKQKRLVIVDVQKLIEDLTKRGVCLGRAPGFRRKDVDMAFKASLLQGLQAY